MPAAIMPVRSTAVAHGIRLRAGVEIVDVIAPLHGVVHFLLVPQIAHRRCMKIVMRELGHPVVGQSLVHEPPMVKTVMVYNHTAMKRKNHAVMRHDKWPVIMRPEMVVPHKCEKAHAQPEIKTHAYARATEEPVAVHKNRARRQWCPADVTVIVVMPPYHPRRCIVKSRHPDPAGVHT